MRLDHLLSKEEEVENVCFTVELSKVRDFGSRASSVAAAPYIQSKQKAFMEAELPTACLFRLCTYLSNTNLSGGDAFRGNTHTHPEHDG